MKYEVGKEILVHDVVELDGVIGDVELVLLSGTTEAKAYNCEKNGCFVCRVRESGELFALYPAHPDVSLVQRGGP